MKRIIKRQELVDDICQLSRALNLIGYIPEIQKMYGIENLISLHDKLSDLLNFRRASIQIDGFAKEFPRPPIPPREDIEPVTSFNELIGEGYYIHQNVGYYAEKVLAGKCYIYRVLSPERATVEVVITPDGQHRIEQVYLGYNRKPSLKTSLKIKRWLEEWEGGQLATPKKEVLHFWDEPGWEVYFRSDKSIEARFMSFAVAREFNIKFVEGTNVRLIQNMVGGILRVDIVSGSCYCAQDIAPILFFFTGFVMGGFDCSFLGYENEYDVSLCSPGEFVKKFECVTRGDCTGKGCYILFLGYDLDSIVGELNSITDMLDCSDIESVVWGYVEDKFEYKSCMIVVG